MATGNAIIMAVAFAVVSSIIMLVVFVPVAGVVTRYRINYTPIGVGLGDGDEQRISQDMRVGPVVNSIWEMFGRVKRLEGWGGLYKGIMPLLITFLLNYTVGIIVVGSTSTRMTLDAGGPILSSAWILLITLISIPGEILMNRTITTPHKLGSFSPRTSLRVLFTAYERQRPWVLYMTPGLALAQTLHVLYFFTVARGIRALLIPQFQPNNIFLMGGSSTKMVANAENGGGTMDLTFWTVFGMMIYAIFLALSFIILTPLEVLSARLSVQRNHPRGTLPVAATEDTSFTSPEMAEVQYAGAEEDVIALRDENTPYTSLIDAYNKVREEEGPATLYRCWWLTMIGALSAGFA